MRWVTLQESWRDGLASIAVGGICAVYLGPLVEPGIGWLVDGLDLDADQETGFSGFVVGIGSVTVTGLGLDVLRLKAKPFSLEGSARSISREQGTTLDQEASRNERASGSKIDATGPTLSDGSGRNDR